MGLRDELDAPPKSGQQCMTCAWLDKMDAATRAEWMELLTDEAIGTSVLYRLAHRKGLPALLSAFRHHRSYHMESTSVAA